MIFRFKKLPFPFGKIVNSVSKGFLNGQFRLAIDTVHKNYCLRKKYKLRIRVLSKSHMISKPLRASPALRDWRWFMCVAEQAGLISTCILCRECLAWIVCCDDWTEYWSTYMYVHRYLGFVYNKNIFFTHFLCACTVGMIFSVHTCSDDSDPCPGHGNVTCTWQLACEGLYCYSYTF